MNRLNSGSLTDRFEETVFDVGRTEDNDVGALIFTDGNFFANVVALEIHVMARLFPVAKWRQQLSRSSSFRILFV